MLSKAGGGGGVPSPSPGTYGIKVADIADAVTLRRLSENLMDYGVL